MATPQEQRKIREIPISAGANAVLKDIVSEEALYLSSNAIFTEHLLLALVTASAEGTIAPIFDTLGLDPKKIRSDVAFMIGGRPEKRKIDGQNLYRTPRSLKAVELGLEEFRMSGAKEMNSMHILIGLVREGQGLSADILSANGIDYDQLERLREVAKKIEDPKVNSEVDTNELEIQMLNRFKIRLLAEAEIPEEARAEGLNRIEDQIALAKNQQNKSK